MPYPWTQPTAPQAPKKPRPKYGGSAAGFPGTQPLVPQAPRVPQKPGSTAGWKPPQMPPNVVSTAGPSPAPIPAAPGAAATEKPAAPATSQDQIDQMIADMVRRQLEAAGKVDTSQQEALIKEQMGDQLGAALVEQRAGMGRAGFGSSGAMAALESDAQRKARQAMTEQVLGVRTSEQQRAFENAQAAIGSELDMRRAAQEQFIAEALLKMAGAETEGADTSAASPGSGPGSGAFGGVGPTSGWGDSPATATAGSGTATVDNKASLPPDAANIGTDADGNDLYYSSTTGKRYTVKKGR